MRKRKPCCDGYHIEKVVDFKTGKPVRIEVHSPTCKFAEALANITGGMINSSEIEICAHPLKRNFEPDFSGIQQRLI